MLGFVMCLLGFVRFLSGLTWAACLLAFFQGSPAFPSPEDPWLTPGEPLDPCVHPRSPNSLTPRSGVLAWIPFSSFFSCSGSAGAPGPTLTPQPLNPQLFPN